MYTRTHQGGRLSWNWYVARVATPADLTRKVRQLDNDMQSVYEMLERIEITQLRMAATQMRQGNRLDELAGRLDEVATAQTEQGAVLNRIVALLERREPNGD